MSYICTLCTSSCTFCTLCTICTSMEGGKPGGSTTEKGKLWTPETAVLCSVASWMSYKMISFWSSSTRKVLSSPDASAISGEPVFTTARVLALPMSVRVMMWFSCDLSSSSCARGGVSGAVQDGLKTYRYIISSYRLQHSISSVYMVQRQYNKQ